MNKTQNTLENKAKFMALYWGQKVLTTEKLHPELYEINREIRPVDNIHFLELTPLSKITDEDLIHISKIDLIRSGEYDEKVTDFDLIEFGKNEFLSSEKDVQYLFYGVIDYLRSRGYALPWMDLSVEDLVYYGWLKLKS